MKIEHIHYQQVFPGENDTTEEPSAGAPSLLIWQQLAVIDSEVFSRDEGETT
jgi:hypothetical protein